MKQSAATYKLNTMDFVLIAVGSLIAAISFNAFLLPNQIVSGGVSGISTIIHAIFGWEPSMIQLMINIPLLFLCFILLGKEAGYKTILGSILLPIFVNLTDFLPTVTDNMLLASVFGGVITGAGIGIVFRAKASTGGTSILVQILHEYAHLSLGLSTNLVDGLTIVFAFIVFDVETIMYSLIAVFLMARTIDQTQVGLSWSKNIFIVTDNPEKIQQAILTTLNRGVSKIPIQGGYSKKDMDMLMCVIPEKELTILKDTVLNVDSDAFVIAMQASEVLGRGFTLHQEYPFLESDKLDL